MHQIERAVRSSAGQALWERIAAHPFERAGQSLDFTRRLARDRGWSLDFARGAVDEYRRFCFLAMVSDFAVTPSEEVDEVWHLHLTYSRDYWDVWCGQVLRGKLHHDPTSGGPAEARRYRSQYAETLALYEGHFGPPDLTYWPAAHERFRQRPRYRAIDTERVLVLPRPRLFGWLARMVLAIAAAGLGTTVFPAPAMALPLNPLDWTAEPFLTLYVTLIAAAFVFAIVQDRRLRRGTRSRPPASNLDLVEIGWLAGGRARAASTVILGFLDAKAARFVRYSAPGRWRVKPDFTVDDSGLPLPAPIEPYRGLVSGEVTHKEFVEKIGPRLDRVKIDLTQRGLIPSEAMSAQIRRLVLFVFGSVVVLGLLKIAVGVSRDKPVGFLLLLIVLSIVIGSLYFLRRPGLTQNGDETLEAYRQRYVRAASSPRDAELLFAFALTGSAVLAGTHLAEYRHHAQNSGSSGGDGGSSDGGDGGGGGCGGCGGGD